MLHVENTVTLGTRIGKDGLFSLFFYTEMLKLYYVDEQEMRSKKLTNIAVFTTWAICRDSQKGHRPMPY